MPATITWTLTGAALGTAFSAAGILSQYFFFTGANRSFADLLKAGPVYWFLLLIPFLSPLLGFAAGAMKTRLVLTARDLEDVRAQLGDTEQQSEIKKLMEELSVNLDHLQDITNNIHEGICVIDRNCLIEYGFNRRFQEIFGHDEYTGKSILESIFRNTVSDIKREIRDFIDLCFQNPATSDSMLNDVNPITKFSYFFFEGGKEHEKIVKTKIVRIRNLAGDIENLMFIFEDVTIDEKMDIALEKQERAYQDELSIISLIFKNDKDMMINFINESNDVIEKVQQKYLEIEPGSKNSELLFGIQGIIHLIKGEAFSLGFEEIAKAAGDFEAYIKTIAHETISLEHNLAIIEMYENLYNRINKVNTVAQKLFSISEGTRKLGSDVLAISVNRYNELKKETSEIIERYTAGVLNANDLGKLKKRIDGLDMISLDILRKELSLVNEKAALKHNKRVILNFIYDMDGLPEIQYRIVKETLVHLIRNSIAHGIEDSAARREKGKDETGRINIHIFQENTHYAILYADDGAGFDLEKIKTKAIANGLADARSATSLSENDIIGFIFKEGFSTTEDADVLSGTGIGMPVVKQNVLQELKGTLKIKNRRDKGVSFKIIF